MMLAHYHGQVWNASELARAFAVAHTTVQRYLDILTATFMVRQLQSWHENLGKRQVKAPKIYLRDSGLLHTLLGLPDAKALDTHPKVGASWEGFALEAVIGRLGARPEECFFWATYSGAEIDLLVVRGRHRIGVRFKRTTAPTVTRSMHVAADDLRLDRVSVVHAGRHSFEMTCLDSLALSRPQPLHSQALHILLGVVWFVRSVRACQVRHRDRRPRSPVALVRRRQHSHHETRVRKQLKRLIQSDGFTVVVSL